MYAFYFKPKHSGINHKEIFVVMSFAKKYDKLFNKLIAPATEEANKMLGYEKNQPLIAYRTKDDIRTTSGWINVLEHLTTAQIVLGVLTGNNLNVFYELGIAHATQPIARQILIAKKGYKPSFDTKDLIYFPYDEKNLKDYVVGLATKIVDAIKIYKIEEEKEIKRARQLLGPYDFETLMAYGGQNLFSVKTSKDFEMVYEKQHGKGSLSRHVQGITNLCQYGLLAFNTASQRSEGTGTRIEFAYYWTNFGNDLLFFLEIINEATLTERRIGLPGSIVQ